MLAKEEGTIKRKVWAYVLTGIAAAIAAPGAIVAFLYAQYAVGAILSALFVILILCFAGEIVQDNFYQKSERLFVARKYEEEKALLDQVKSNHLLFPFVRERYYLISIRNALARDELSLAKSYIERLRHSGDPVHHGENFGMKYKTAYAYILILLDEGNTSEARAEYEDFRIHNEHYAIYQTRLEILNALFARLFSKYDAPLPEAAINSPYPVIKRILGRHVEEDMAASHEGWGE